VALQEQEAGPVEESSHYKSRLAEVEPDLGRRGKWTFLLQVLLWVAILLLVVVGYALMGRSI
jgi:hypothetical protein